MNSKNSLGCLCVIIDLLHGSFGGEGVMCLCNLISRVDAEFFYILALFYLDMLAESKFCGYGDYVDLPISVDQCFIGVLE